MSSMKHIHNSTQGCAQGQIAKVNDINIWYETFGNKKNKPLLLIMGGCCQGVLWHRAFCERLVNEGFYVIRYDHRDSGLSTCFDFEKNPYGLMDMAKDALDLLNVLGIERAHLFGVSLGAILAEIMAASFPNRINSILLMSSTPEMRPMNLVYAGKSPEQNATHSSPKQEYLDWMHVFMKQLPETHEEKLAQRIEGWRLLSGSVFPLDEEINREIQGEFLERLRYPKGILNHISMLNTTQAEELIRVAPSKIQTPTVILQGSEDSLFPPDHGDALSKKIHHSEYILVKGMGHIPSDHFYDLYVKVLKEQTIMF